MSSAIAANIGRFTVAPLFAGAETQAVEYEGKVIGTFNTADAGPSFIKVRDRVTGDVMPGFFRFASEADAIEAIVSFHTQGFWVNEF